MLDFSDALAIVPPRLVEEVESFLAGMNAGERIQRYALLMVEFWDPEDQQIFDEEFGLAVEEGSPTESPPEQE